MPRRPGLATTLVRDPRDDAKGLQLHIDPTWQEPKKPKDVSHCRRGAGVSAGSLRAPMTMENNSVRNDTR